MATTIAVAGIVASLAATGYGVARDQGAFGDTTPSAPKPPPVDTSALSKGLLPGAKADAAARTGGGFSPDFLAGLIGQQGGSASLGQDILPEITAAIGRQQGP